MTDPMHVIEKFGLQNSWVLWRLARGDLDQFCPRCRGEGIIIQSPCRLREPGQASGQVDGSDFSLASAAAKSEPICSLAVGCAECRSTCPQCEGSRLLPPDPLHAEDFGDETSLELARRLSGGLVVDERSRIDRNPRAL